MKSNTLTAVEQGSLRLACPPSNRHVSDDLIFAQPSLMAAINLCISVSGLDKKKLYLPLGIDAGHWTRITSGAAHFPTDKLTDLMDLCGNEIPLQWLANARGKGLVMLISETERRLQAETQRADAAESELAVLRKYVGVLK